jgi:hypothetical protein
MGLYAFFSQKVLDSLFVFPDAARSLIFLEVVEIILGGRLFGVYEVLIVGRGIELKDGRLIGGGIGCMGVMVHGA